MYKTSTRNGPMQHFLSSSDADRVSTVFVSDEMVEQAAEMVRAAHDRAHSTRTVEIAPGVFRRVPKTAV